MNFQSGDYLTPSSLIAQLRELYRLTHTALAKFYDLTQVRLASFAKDADGGWPPCVAAVGLRGSYYCAERSGQRCGLQKPSRSF